MGKTELTRNSAIVFAATFVSSLCTFIFQVMMGRAMTLDYFGQFSALLSVQLIFSVLTGALILLYTRHAAKLWMLKDVGSLRWLYSHAWRVMAMVGFACAAIVAVTSFAWRGALNIESFGMVAMAALLISVFFLQAVPLAFVRGLQKFHLFGIGLTSAGILKLLLGGIFIYIGITVTNAILAVMLAVILSFLIMHRMLGSFLNTAPETPMKLVKDENISYCIKAMAGTFFPMFFVNADMILVRSLFAPETSGHYAALVVIGKVIFLSGTVVAIALFPATVSAGVVNKQVGNELIYRAMLLLVLVGGAVTGLTYFFPSEIMALLFKMKDAEVAMLLPYYCATLLAVSLVMLEAHYRLARQQYGFLWVAATAAVMQTAGIIYFSHSLGSIIKFQMSLFWVVFAVRFVSILMEHKPAMEEAIEP